MKRLTIKRRQPTSAKASIASLTPQSDSPPERHVHTVTVHIGGRRYEMNLHPECRDYQRPAQLIEMPRRSAKKQ
jgi:hypothetical protein